MKWNLFFRSDVLENKVSVLNWNQWVSAKKTRSIQTVLLAPFCPYCPWQQQEYEYFNSRRAVWFFPRRWRLRWHITGKLLNSTSGKLDQRVRDNSIKCSCWEDQAFWCCPSPLSSNCKAVTLPEIYNDKTDSCWLGTWHWGESGPGAHTHPSAPVSSQRQDSGAKDWHGGGGSWGNLMSHSAELSALPPLQYENITVMKMLLIAVAFPLDKLQRFLCHSVVWREPRWNPRRHHRQCSITVGRPCVNFSCAQSKKGLKKKD